GAVTFGPQIAINMNAFRLIHENPCMPYPPLGTSTTAIFDASAGAFLTTDGGQSFHAYEGTAHMSAHYTTTSDNGVNKNVDAEILSLDLSGGTFPAGMQFRESPTLASVGSLASEAVLGGGLAMHADLDLFMEVSTNSG